MKHKIYLLLLGILFLSPLAVNAQPIVQKQIYVLCAKSQNGIRTELNNETAAVVVITTSDGRFLWKNAGYVPDEYFVLHLIGQNNGWYTYSQNPGEYYSTYTYMYKDGSKVRFHIDLRDSSQYEEYKVVTSDSYFGATQ